MWQYKIGDTVVIDSYENILSKGDLITYYYISFDGHHIPFSQSMRNFCNKEFVISELRTRTGLPPNREIIPVYMLKGAEDYVKDYIFTEEMILKSIPRQKFDFSELLIEI